MSMASRISDGNNPNLDLSPPELSHLPRPRAASLARTPMIGRTLSCLDHLMMVSTSDGFSTTITTLRPSLAPHNAISMNSSSL
jgi:hypothetical protein